MTNFHSNYIPGQSQRPSHSTSDQSAIGESLIRQAQMTHLLKQQQQQQQQRYEYTKRQYENVH